MRRLVPGVLLASAASASLVLLGLAPATAAPQAAPTGPVTANPAATPQLNATGTTEQVRQIAQCGNTMYAVGTFTALTQGGTTYPRNNVFSFSASKPYTMTSWNPNVNGIVNGDHVQRRTAPPPTSAASSPPVDGTAVKQPRRGQHLDRRRWSRPSGTAPAARSRRCSEYNGHILAGRLLHLDQQRQRQRLHDQPQPRPRARTTGSSA